MSDLKKNKLKIKTEWNLTPFYKSPDDKKIEEDIKKAEKDYIFFAEKYKNIVLDNPKIVREALDDYFKLNELRLTDSYTYLSKLIDLDSRKEYLHSKSNLLIHRIQNISNKTLFFEVNLSKIKPEIQNILLSDNELSKYHYYLKVIFTNSKYVLSEKEEKILNLKYLTSHKLWVDFTENLYSKSQIKYKNKNIPISKATNMVRTLKTQKERYDLFSKIKKVNEQLSHIAEKELNAIILDKKINDELRGFVEPVDSTIISHEDNKQTVFALRDAVTQNYSLVHKFFKIKKKMLKLKKMYHSDRFAEVGKINKKYNFETGVNILNNILSSTDKEFSNIFQNFLKNGQIDVFPKIGKRGGAYCSSTYKNPTYVFLNYIDDLDSVYTLAHEMGHAIHSELSKVQPVYYQGYSISTAEVASTFFETLMFNELYNKLSPKEKVIALHDKISDSVGTIFLQIMLFNYELELHSIVKAKGNLSKEEMAKLMMKHFKQLYGKEFTYEENTGYAFVGWSHIRYFFYTYTYAMGLIVSKSLYDKYSQDKSYIEKIKKFLSSGGSMSPEDIFKSIGIDITNKDFWIDGIRGISNDISELEKLISKNGIK